ncbi:MAG: polyphosphate polymerase domain-containing protein [Clostridia bacterium]|nr:polyphosphate polymerase domain-containing protein [Clostridia bacterium]
MAIEVFNRYEHKYMLDKSTFEKVVSVIQDKMEYDKHNKNGAAYTISNIYYDTADDYLIRTSLSKPAYKEKLRLRSYGVPDMDSEVFLEIKKKYRGIVNKRRTTLRLGEAYDFVQNGAVGEYHDYMNTQVVHELEYFLKVHNVQPKLYLAYDRIAFFDKHDKDLRISFDTNIRSRRYDLRLEHGSSGEQLLDKDLYLMEVKTSKAKPLWLCHLLTDLHVYRTSFSKYGTEYKQREYEVMKKAI